MRVRASACLLAVLAVLVLTTQAEAKERKLVKFCRFQAGETTAYGLVEGETVTELEGDLFGKWKPTERKHKLADVKLLTPCRPSQIFAMAGNYKSHLGGGDTITTITTTTRLITGKDGETRSESKTDVDVNKPGSIPEKFRIPQLFLKSPTCVIPTGESIIIPPGTNNVHYEGEMVIVIGKRAKNVSESEALEYVLGVTCGNDVSARDWQKGDVQWWRAKGSDTFGPIGPFIASGLDYDNLRLRTRLNGKTVQDCNTRELLQNTAKMVSFISRHVTLHPGDIIFTGTSGTTQAIKPGDVVEVEIEGVGVLRNPVAGSR